MARSYVGTKETTPNKGPEIELFQGALGDTPHLQSYCALFVHYLCQQVDKRIRQDYPSWPQYALYKSPSAVQMYQLSPKATKVKFPDEGLIVVWQHYVGNTPQWTGHCGVVVELSHDGTMITVEANTSDPQDPSINRDGDGVYLKVRHTSSDTGPMRLLGFCDPWGS